MPYEWCRLPAAFAHDPKVQSMPERMQRRLLMLYCAHSAEHVGSLDDAELACYWRISRRELEKTRTLFMLKGFIDRDWILVAWDEQQPVNETVQLPLQRAASSGASRTRRYRERLRLRVERERAILCDASHVMVGDASPVTKTSQCDVIESDKDPELEKECDARDVTCDASPTVTDNVTPFQSKPFSSSRAGSLQLAAARIIIAHPRALLRGWTDADIPSTHLVETVAAIKAEAQKTGASPAAAAEIIHRLVTQLARDVPRHRWGFFKDIPEFMQLREYRVDAVHFTRSGESNGRSAHYSQPQPTATVLRQPRSPAATEQCRCYCIVL